MPIRDPLHVLQFGPMWMLSAITGTESFAAIDREVFAEILDNVIHRTPAEAREVLQTVADGPRAVRAASQRGERAATAAGRGTVVLVGARRHSAVHHYYAARDAAADCCPVRTTASSIVADGDSGGLGLLS